MAAVWEQTQTLSESRSLSQHQWFFPWLSAVRGVVLSCVLWFLYLAVWGNDHREEEQLALCCSSPLATKLRLWGGEGARLLKLLDVKILWSCSSNYNWETPAHNCDLQQEQALGGATGSRRGQIRNKEGAENRSRQFIQLRENLYHHCDQLQLRT